MQSGDEIREIEEVSKVMDVGALQQGARVVFIEALRQKKMGGKKNQNMQNKIK